jgi:hypothetical protein
MLVGILEKMRTEGGVKLLPPEWQAISNTAVTESNSGKLEGCEDFYQSCYTWSVVNMAYAIRSMESAKLQKATLFVTIAEDVVLNVLETETRSRGKAIGEAIFEHANMNMTGRMPHYGLYHVGMQIRATQTLEQPDVPLDSTGTIVGFDFDPVDACRTDLNQSFVVLRKLPCAMYVQMDDNDKFYVRSTPCRNHLGALEPGCTDCRTNQGLFAVKPFTNVRPWSLDIEIGTFQKEQLKVRVKRRQMPVVTVKASTLHVMQGTTADPGLIFHWRFPRRLRTDMRWLATYVAFSRVRSLSQFRSVGLTADIRKIIEQGPPDSLPKRFKMLFADKEVATNVIAEEALRILGWDN